MKIYEYSLLQYQYSSFLGEIINIGIAIYFPESGKLYFKYPNNLTRLEKLYPGEINSNYILETLSVIEKSCSEVSLIDGHLREILNRILPEDNSALQFGGFRKSLIYKETEADIITENSKYYLKYYVNGC